MLGKLDRILKMGLAVAALPFAGGDLPEPEAAEEKLKEIWPDRPSGCVRERGESRERTLDLSVIIPNYNNRDYVIPCVRSVLDQETDICCEVIVVDDGSPDDSRSLLEETFGGDPRVKLIHQENKGLSGARNTGVGLAEGRYLMFLDADDKLLPGAVQTLMKTALEKNALAVAGGYLCVFPDGTTRPGRLYRDEKLDPRGKVAGYAWGKVFDAALFDRLRFPEGYWFEDSITAQILWPLCKDSCYTVKEPVYGYLVNPKGISAQAARRPRALESLWLYRRLMEDRGAFGLEVTQEDYEFFLDMVRLTYYRTGGFTLDAKKCIFVLQRALQKQYFSPFRTRRGGAARLTERALDEAGFRRYALVGELPL